MTFKDREFEIKFATDAAGLAAAWESKLLDAPSEPVAKQSLRSVYYDTPDGELMRRGITLRLRRNGRGTPTVTLKWSATTQEGPFARAEIEARHPRAELDIGVLGEVAATELREIIGERPLEPRFETKFKRRLKRLTIGGAQLEASFDEGEIVAGERRAALTELELELKSGEQADFYDFATRLAEALPLRLETLSKSTRGYLLTTNARPFPVKSRDTIIPNDASFDDAVAIVVGDTLKHFLANWASLRDDVHPEAIHQMRVALRRMRALLGLFQREAPCPEFVAFRDEAKRIANALGPARECDAFAGLVAEGPRAAFEDRKTFAALDDLMSARRETLHGEARRLIAGAATANFVLRLQSFLAKRGWRNALAPEQLPRLTRPAHAFAAEALERLHERALKRGKGLLAMPDEQRHELRLALKKLRYAAEFFGGVFFDPEGVRLYLRRVARLQDLLGAHNDAASAGAFLDGVKARERSDTAFAAGVVRGWLAGRAAIGDHELKRAWKSFKTAPAFWR